VTGSDDRVQVRFFAHYRELTGVSACEVALPPGATVGDLVTMLRADRRFEALPEVPLVAVNQEYADPQRGLRKGDEVAVIPPVSGG
jgi:molybdopterin converting factor subunit 1